MEDPLYDEAINFIRNGCRQCLAQREEVKAIDLQRHLNIGYNRACLLLEQLEEDNIIAKNPGCARWRLIP